MKSCDKCKHYDGTLEFNCTKFNMVTQSENANKCRFFDLKIKRRKRCNKCKHLKYKYLSSKKKYLYVCEKHNKPKSYTTLILCNKFEKIE